MPQDAIDQLLRLNPDQQREAIGRLSPQERQTIMGMIQQRQTPAKPPSFGASGSWAAPTVPGVQGAIPADAQLRAQTPGERWESFTQAHPYLTQPITAITGIGRGVTEGIENIVGMPRAIYHAVTDPLTPEEKADPAYSDFGSSVTTPIRRLTLEEQFRLFDQARAELRADRPGAAAFHLMTSLVPFGGPLAAHLEQRFRDDPYGAIGEGLTYYVAPDISKEVRGSRTVGELREMAADLANRARDKATQAAQSLTGSRARKVTRPIVEDYLKETENVKEQQKRADEARSRRTEESAKSAAATNVERQQRYAEDVAQAERDAAEKTAAAQKETAKQLAANREAVATNARRESLETGVQRGSPEFGQRVTELDRLLREEGNEKYDTVKAAVKDDPGVPLQELSDAAVYAEQNILKGSAENIKQFRDLVRRSPEDETEGAIINGRFFGSDERAYKDAVEQGMITAGGNLPFDQLQGYSSEIGAKLAKGGLQGDVYQALKYLKDKIDAAKTTIADRNGAGAALRNADSFWRSYMELLYDSDSALTQAREAVGVKNPSEYFNEFMRGKKDEVAISRLKRLRTQNTKAVNAVADLGLNLRSAVNELDTLKAARVKPIEPSTRTVPKTVRPPEVAVGREFPRRMVREPVAPTAADILRARTDVIERMSDQFKSVSRWDIVHLISGGGLTFLLRQYPLASMATALFTLTAPKLLGAVLDMESVKAAITRPTAADLAEVSKLPEPVRGRLIDELQSIINQERAAGRPLNVAPQIERLIGMGAGAPAGIPQSRKDAMERLGRNPVTGQVQGPPATAATAPESSSSLDTEPDQSGLSDTSLQALAGAIAEQEGFYKAGTVPQRQRNPGDISPGGTVATYGTEEEGWNRLYDQIRSYDPDMTLAEIGRGARGRGGYAEDPNWAAGVAAALSRATGKTISVNMTLDEIDDALSGQQ